MCAAEREALNAAEKWLVPRGQAASTPTHGRAAAAPFKADGDPRRHWRDGARDLRKDLRPRGVAQGARSWPSWASTGRAGPAAPTVKPGMQIAIHLRHHVRRREASRRGSDDAATRSDGIWRVAGYFIRCDTARDHEHMLSAELHAEDRSRGRQVPARPEAVGGDVGARASRRTSTAGCRPTRWMWSRSYLGMPPIAVYEVASFYTMYNLKPQGRFKITICTNLPCALPGANAAAEHLKQRARHRLQRDHAGRQVHAEGRRVHGRVRRRAGAARQQQAHVQLDERRQARRAAGRAVGGRRSRRRPSGRDHRETHES